MGHGDLVILLLATTERMPATGRAIPLLAAGIAIGVALLLRLGGSRLRDDTPPPGPVEPGPVEPDPVEPDPATTDGDVRPPSG